MLKFAQATAPPGRVADWREICWADHAGQASIAGRRVAYVSLGTGEPACVLVHGLASSWQWWLPTIPALAARRRVVALDLPGFGGSEMPARPLSPGVAVD